MSERKNFLGQGNDPFECLHCGAHVEPLRRGFRNHCPECLWCRHVDEIPGDRRSVCGGPMEPVALEGTEGSGWVIVHRCQRCGAVRRNRSAERDPVQPDRWDLLVDLASRQSARRPTRRGRRGVDP